MKTITMLFQTFLIICCVTSFSLAYPFLEDAGPCFEKDCKIDNNCRCSSTKNPLTGDDPAPQLIGITVSESVVVTLYENYLQPLFFDRINPDGNSITLSFYVNHEYTDYELVQKLYLRGYEIGVHSITKNSSQAYWKNATLQDLTEEFGGQKTILNTFANIPAEDIVGARTPQLQLKDDISIQAYVDSGLDYDNSWPTFSSKKLFPYTLDYKSTQDCIVTLTCPTESHPGFWIAPITNIKGAENVECNSLATCLVDGSADDIANWLLGEVDRYRTDNRDPLILRLDSYWFSYTDNSYEGFVKFLDQIAQYEDTFLVSVGEIINWVKNPVPYKDFKTATYDRSASCSPVNCELVNLEGQFRYMKSCIPCPRVYPWKGNPLGQ